MTQSDTIDLDIWHKLHTHTGILKRIVFEQFVAAGYPVVQLTSLTEWNHIHTWCAHHIERDHYTWYGSRFIFVNEADAVKFSLTWT